MTLKIIFNYIKTKLKIKNEKIFTNEKSNISDHKNDIQLSKFLFFSGSSNFYFVLLDAFLLLFVHFYSF